MTLTFGITKNKTGYQAECLEKPEIVACGWTWEQLVNTIIEHTEAWSGEIKNIKPAPNFPDTKTFCGYVIVIIDTNGKARILEEKHCE